MDRFELWDQHEERLLAAGSLLACCSALRLLDPDFFRPNTRWLIRWTGRET